MLKSALRKVVEGEDLARHEAAAVMREIMEGNCTGAQIGFFLAGLRAKGESVEEIAGCAEIMREKATPVRVAGDVIDTCGTGGDAAGTFNISTAAALVAAGAGVRVAKHGNRSVSSGSGSSDALAALGVNIEAETAKVERCIAEAGIGFLFAPLLHGAMKHAIGPRREIGVRTVFNILGPLTNPAGAKRQLLGVYESVLAPTLALVLKELGSLRALVVHGHDGLDEITVCEETTVAELKDGEVCEYVIAPEDYDFRRYPSEALTASGPEESARIIRGILAGKAGAPRDVVLLNAGAALYVAGKAEDMVEGIARAADSIDSGNAAAALKKLVAISNS